MGSPILSRNFINLGCSRDAQYVTSRGLGKYLTKYVVKPEPTRIFRTYNSQTLRFNGMYVLTTRGKNMQFVYCSKYLTTEMPNMRSRATRPICLIDDDNPYWNDSIDKYFAPFT